MGKIGFYCSSTGWGGLEMNFIRYAKWFSERNHDVIVYCVQNTPFADKIKDSDLEVSYVRKNKKYYDIINAFRVHDKIKQDGVKVIWIRDTRDISLIGLVKTISGNKIKIIYHQAMQMGTSKRDLLHTIRYSKLDAWITLLPFLAAQIKKRTRFREDRIHIIPEAINLKQGLTNHSKVDARKALDIPEDKFIIGVLGRIDPHKGQLFLIEALAKLRNKNKNIELLIVGESTRDDKVDYQAVIENRIVELNFGEFVHIRPFMDDVEVFYQAIDLFAMVSKNETFGMVTIEAMIHGVPVIGTNASGTPEILDNGNLGSLYEVGDVTDFCDKVKWILNNPKTISERTLRAQNEAKLKYNHKTVCDQIEVILSNLSHNK